MTGELEMAARPRCGDCRHFVTDPVALEQLLPGLLILGSASGDSFAGQGLCRRHGEMLTAEMSCSSYAEPE